MQKKILVVDDDERILQLLTEFLNKNGYITSGALSAQEAQKLLEQDSFDLLIIDVMMPEITGFELTSSIKKLQNVPVILLTALNKVEDRIQGLESGADDYVSKPFDPRELLLRTKNLLDLYSKQKPDLEIFVFGQNTYNLITKEFLKSGQLLTLTSTEQKLLDLFISNKNKVLSRDDLSNVMGSLSPRSIDVQIARLRSKIQDAESKYLRTVRHLGYVLHV